MDSSKTTVRLGSNGGLACTLAVFLLAGCATTEFPEPIVSAQLSSRAGQELGEQTEAGALTLPPGVSLGGAISDETAVRVALWNNAAFLELMADLGVARADVVAAGEIANPIFQALLPIGPKQLEFNAKVPLQFLWLRGQRISAADLQARRVGQRLVQDGLDLIRDVKVACADLRLANGLVATKAESIELLEQSAVLAESRLNAGDISELDAATARIAALNAQQDWSLAVADAKQAEVGLRTLLGLAQGTSQIALAELPEATFEPIGPSMEELIEDSLKNRPDLRSAELALEAAGKQVRLSRQEWFALAAILDANGSGSDFESGPGLEFPIPIFNRNQGAISLAQAKLEQALRSYISVRDKIVLEVQQAYIRSEQSFQSLQSWILNLQPELEAAVAAADAGVRSGDLAPLQAIEAERTLNSARANQQFAMANWQKSIAELERAIGHRLDDNFVLANDADKSMP